MLALAIAFIAVAGIVGAYLAFHGSNNEMAVGKDTQAESQDGAAHAQSLASPADGLPVVIGAINDDASKTISRFQPTADYVAEKLSTDEQKYIGEVVVTRNADEMIQKLRNNEVDVYFESPFGSLIINEATGATLELLRWKDGVSEYNSVFVVRKDSDINSLDDFRGRSIAFESPESTSSHFLPRAYLLEKSFEFQSADYGESPLTSTTESGSSLRYYFSGEDENTPYWVVERKVDIGAMSNINYDEIPSSIKGELRIVAETEEVPRHVVSFRGGLEQSFADQIKLILTGMEFDPEGKEVMSEFQDTARYSEIPDAKATLARLSEMLRLVQDDSGDRLSRPE